MDPWIALAIWAAGMALLMWAEDKFGLITGAPVRKDDE